MPSLLHPPFNQLIPLLPVLDHSEEVQSQHWVGLFAGANLGNQFNQIFHDAATIRISRDRLRNFAYPNGEQKCLEILLWGYPTGMRGNQHLDFLNNIKQIAATAAEGGTWQQYHARLDAIPHLGPSTISKIAYFFRRTFEDAPALILDRKIIDRCAEGRWEELHDLHNNGDVNYLAYLTRMNSLAERLRCRPDQLECFLFLFGRNF